MNEPILIDNLATQPQSAWVFCGMPEDQIPGAAGFLTLKEMDQEFLWVRGRGGIRIQVKGLPPGSHRLEWGDLTDPPVFHYAVDIMRMRPTWMVDGDPSDDNRIIQVVEEDGAHARWVMRATNPRTQWVHELWLDVFHDQSTIEFVAHSTFGTTDNSAPQDYVRLVPDLRMRLDYPMHRDHGVRVRLPANEWVGDNTFSLQLAEPGVKMFRTTRISNRGAILARPDPARLEGKRMWAVWSGWPKSGKWPPYGKVPELPINWQSEENATRDQYETQKPVGYWASRPDVQPRWAETTGEQPGFGASTCGRVVTRLRPWAIDWLLWCCDAYAYRPSCFREPDGQPMSAWAHAWAETIDGIVWPGWSRGDRLGWHEQVPIPPFWVDWSNDFPERSEHQHRDGTTMCLAYLLTRDPGLGQIIQDNLQLALLDARLKNGWLEAPRAIGRVLLERCLMHMVGFTEIKPLIQRHVDLLVAQCPIRPAHLATIIGQPDKAVGGWVDQQGQAVIGTQTWQQSIAITQGLIPAYMVTGDKRVLDLAMAACRTVVDVGFRMVNGQWAHTYAWATGNFEIPPAEKFDGGTNDTVTMNPDANYWTLACCELLASREPGTPLGKKAGAVLLQFGQPRIWSESQWRCVQ